MANKKDRKDPDGASAKRGTPAWRALRGAGTVGKIAGKGTLLTAKGVGKVSTGARNTVGSAAHRAFGGHRYARRAEDVNGRIADAFASLDGVLRHKDAEIAELRSENARLRAAVEAR